jgi:hypothetical protein
MRPFTRIVVRHDVQGSSLRPRPDDSFCTAVARYLDDDETLEAEATGDGHERAFGFALIHLGEEILRRNPRKL